MTKLLVGLGNPGDKYFETKHNVGFMLIDQLAKKQNVSFTHDKIFQAGQRWVDHSVCYFSIDLIIHNVQL